jgi:hypothetical protein
MTLEKSNSMASRVLFLAAFVLLAVALVEKAVNLVGYTFVRQISTGAGRLLEFAAIFLIFVIALLLRQIREELKRK